MLVTDEWKKERLSRAYSGDLNVPSSMNRATQALFWEYRHQVRWKQRGIVPQYNLSRKDKEGTLSMRQIYLQCDSEYEAALVLLGNYDHWLRLLGTPWFPAHVEKWRAEKIVVDSAMGRGLIIKAAAGGNIAAAKYLDQLSKEKPERPAPTKGRSKAVVTPDAEKDEPDEWMQRALELSNSKGT